MQLDMNHNLLFDSDAFAVVQYTTFDEGFNEKTYVEIVSKTTMQSGILEPGAEQSAFRAQADAWLANVPTSDEVDLWLTRYEPIMLLPVVLH